ncbi:MAG TPA: terminase small subunit [Candidatus Binataceae bacterium]|nr:terminase small subunit [Candidatus Binataceae bacterium]
MSWGNHKRPLGTRQQKFVEHYLITGVASQAAIRAGYSPASAWSAGSRLKRDPRVANAIRVGRANEARRAQISHERVVLELARVAFSDIGEVLDWTSGDDVTLRPKTKISPHHRAAIAEIAPRRMGQGLRIKFHSKARALEALARHLGVYDKTVPAAPPPDPRRDGRDARTILVERLKRLARASDNDTDSMNAGAPLYCPSPRDSGEREG